MVRSFNKNKNTQRQTPKGRNITVKEAGTLLDLLFKLIPEQSKSSVKAMLKWGQISLNGKCLKQFDAPVSVGDVITVSHERAKAEFNHPMLKIVWEDESLLVVNKKQGLLSIANDREKEKTAFHILSDYLKEINPRNKIFVVHRLDRDTSGLMIFAKNQEVKDLLQSNWNDLITDRSYVAVVEGKPEKDTDLISSYLSENRGMKVYVSSDGVGQEAITRYKTLRSNGQYSLLELTLETGRKNQIRAHLESIGHPVTGDPKYGSQSNPIGRLALHARKLNFTHPITKEKMRFETPVPSSFNVLVKL